jgi:OPA family glycerol-3-phosphate transporter-like MFS transporter
MSTADLKEKEATSLTQKKQKKYTPYQGKILFLCFIAYICAYMMRLNFSVANPALCEALSLTTDKTGVISSAFLITYAIGQLISGRLGDIIPTKIMLTVGLSVSAVTNFLMGLSTSYYVMIAVWLVNGLFQSMLWSPIIRCLSHNFEGKNLISASFTMSLSCIAGYVLAWSSSSLLRNLASWRTIFIVPACFSALVVVLLIAFFKEDPSQYVPAAIKSAVGNDSTVRPPSILKNKAIIIAIVFTVFAAIFHGFVREGINSWLPTMIENSQTFSAGAATLILIITPCINFGGLSITKKVLAKCKSDAYKGAKILTAVSIIACVVPPLLGFIFTGKAYWILLIVFTVLIFALMSALNPMFISFMPLDYLKYNLVSTMTGIIDFAVYVGAAAASVGIGVIYNATRSWTSVTALWLGATVLCLVMLILAQKLIKKQK